MDLPETGPSAGDDPGTGSDPADGVDPVDGVDPADGVERRRHPRTKINTPAQVEFVGYTVDGTLEDVSPGGVKFTTEDPHIRVEPGNFVFVHFELDHGGEVEPLKRAVRVKWVEKEKTDTGELRIFGMEFEDLLAL